MRGLLGRIGARVGVAVVLIVLVGAVLGIAKLTGAGSSRPTTARIDNNHPSSTVDPTAGDDAEVAPTPTATADDTAVTGAASSFLAAWLRRDRSPAAWHAALVPLSTMSLAQSLDGVDPVGVPATRTTGPPTIVRRADAFAQVSIAVDTGTVVLDLIKQNGKWLVDGVDWDRP
jgi:hypothetical protein